MSPGPHRVPAPPNQCEINARVLHKEQDLHTPDQWHLELEILDAKDVQGPNFARSRIGQTTRALTMETVFDLAPEARITAQAEYVGDEHGGLFHLTAIVRADDTPGEASMP